MIAKLLNFLSKYHPSSKKRKKLKFYLRLKEKNNKVFILKNNLERELKPYEQIKKLDLHISGSNNIIKISKDCPLNGLRVDITGDNNYLEINSSQYGIGALSWMVIEGGAKIIIGKDIWVTSRLFMHAQGPNSEIVIGEGCVFARETVIRNSDTHTIFEINHPKKVINPNKSVYIGNHVWVTQKCTILKGVTLPSNCVVGTCSVVSKTPEEGNCIIAGNPAKIIKRNIGWDRRSCTQYVKEYKEKA